MASYQFILRFRLKYIRAFTECQEALSERQFENKIWSAYLVWIWRSRTKRWYWSLVQNQTLRKSKMTLVCEAGVKWLAWLYRFFLNLFSVHFLRKWNLTTVSLAAQMEGVYGAPMFIGSSQNTTLVKPLLRWHCLSPVMVDCCFSLRPCLC